MLEAHIADLNTALALNTMALAAFGITPHSTAAVAGPAEMDEAYR